jgi:hypothetical protein
VGGWGYYDDGPVYYEGAGPAPLLAPAAAPSCTCLGKEYLADGSVRFFDSCTKESAVGEPAPEPRR